MRTATRSTIISLALSGIIALSSCPQLEPAHDAGGDRPSLQDVAGVEPGDGAVDPRDVPGDDTSGPDRRGDAGPGVDRLFTPESGPEVPLGPPCDSAEGCAAGLGCVEGACAPCQDGADCREAAREGCSEGVCGPCQAGGDCALGLGCRAAVGECDPCRVAAECRAGEACIAGACGACAVAADCYGGLCLDGVCTPCRPSADDVACALAYDDPDYVCQGAECAPPSCTLGVDCQLLGRVCSAEGVCEPCSTSQECLASDSGGYPLGTTCVQGSCAVADCESSARCPDERPICGQNFRCRGCQGHDECLARHQVAAGYYCVEATQRCLPGDCYPPAQACGDGSAQVCGDDLSCRPCGDDLECRVSLQSDAAICEDGRCEVGCTPPALDATGRVCGANARFVDCAGDTPCAQAAGYEQQICEGGRCVAGCQAGTLCDDGRVCGADHRCADCAGDSACVAASGDDDAVCELGRCASGCSVPSPCAAGQVCGASHRCIDCTSDGQCAAALGYEHSVCENGRCQDGCRAGGPCPAHEVCGADHRCRPCGGNEDCAGAYSSSYLCFDGDCLEAECNATRPCTLGRVCDPFLHFCRECEDHAECNAGEVCDLSALGGTGRCRAGACTRATQDELCPSGLCASYACVPCDAQHACGLSADGQQRVCVSGRCWLGECTPATQTHDCPDTRLCSADRRCISCYDLNDCGAGRLCDVNAHVCLEGQCRVSAHCGAAAGTTAQHKCDRGTFTCRPCTGDADCRADGDYTPTTICQNGLCQEGCESNAECSTALCLAGRCKPCARDLDCGADRVCDERSGSCVEGDCVSDAECPVSTSSCHLSLCTEVDGERRCTLSYIGDGKPCSDGDPCTTGETCGGSVCRRGADKCADGLACTEDTCQVVGDDGVCSHNILADHCVIDVQGTLTCFPLHAFSPDDLCQWCDPGYPSADSKESWSPTPDGVRCADNPARECQDQRCVWHDGQACRDDAECLHSRCECADAGCSRRVCSGASCLCAYNANGDGGCEGFISDNLDDAHDSCGSRTCAGDGTCHQANGATCTRDGQCQSDQCECANPTCSLRKCSAVDCSCTYNANGDTSCEGNVADGIDDANDTCGGMTCNGSGACHKSNGAVCASRAECESNLCECANSTCSSKRCSAKDCYCTYNANGDGSCEGNILDNLDDADDSCGGSLTCNGGGGCHLPNGQSCSADFFCQSNQCECTNATCSSQKCSAVDCDCAYNTDGNSSCDGYISHGYDDFENSCGVQTCKGDGVCHKANGVACTAASQCGSDKCECANVSCSARVCSAVSCPLENCKYNANGDSTCEGNMTGPPCGDRTCGSPSNPGFIILCCSSGSCSNACSQCETMQ